MSAGRDHQHAPANFNAAFGIGVGLNVAFVAVETFYGWKVNSLALLADAGHNLSDVIGLVLAWGGALAGRLRPDARHTYGWKRASILAAFVNALLLLVAMGSLAWESVHRLQSPQPIEGVTIMVVAAIGIVVNTGGAGAVLEALRRVTTHTTRLIAINVARADWESDAWRAHSQRRVNDACRVTAANLARTWTPSCT